MSTIKVTITRTFRNEPLVALDGGPFSGAELTPERLRALAASLEAVAIAAEKRPCTGRHWMPGRMEIQA